MAVGNVQGKSSNEIVDRWAHDAGLARGDEKVSSSACAKSGTALHKGRNDDMHGATHLGKDILEHGAWTTVEFVAHGTELSTAVQGAMHVAGPLSFAAVALHELKAAKEKEAEIKNAFTNDAVNVALVCSLDFPDAFKLAEKAARPGVDKGAEKLMMKLQGEDKALKPVLQARVDEGFLAAQRAAAATANVPEKDRGAAIARWLDANGFSDRMKNDVAFGKGVEYFGWCSSPAGKAAGASVDTAIAKIEARRVPPQPTMVRG